MDWLVSINIHAWWTAERNNSYLYLLQLKFCPCYWTASGMTSFSVNLLATGCTCSTPSVWLGQLMFRTQIPLKWIMQISPPRIWTAPLRCPDPIPLVVVGHVPTSVWLARTSDLGDTVPHLQSDWPPKVQTIYPWVVDMVSTQLTAPLTTQTMVTQCPHPQFWLAANVRPYTLELRDMVSHLSHDWPAWDSEPNTLSWLHVPHLSLWRHWRCQPKYH